MWALEIAGCKLFTTNEALKDCSWTQSSKRHLHLHFAVMNVFEIKCSKENFFDSVGHSNKSDDSNCTMASSVGKSQLHQSSIASIPLSIFKKNERWIECSIWCSCSWTSSRSFVLFFFCFFHAILFRKHLQTDRTSSEE